MKLKNVLQVIRAPLSEHLVAWIEDDANNAMEQ